VLKRGRKGSPQRAFHKKKRDWPRREKSQEGKSSIRGVYQEKVGNGRVHKIFTGDFGGESEKNGKDHDLSDEKKLQNLEQKERGVELGGVWRPTQEKS